MYAMNIENFKKLKYHIFKKQQVFLLFKVSKIIYKNMEQYLKRKNPSNIKISWFNKQYRRASKNI